MKYFCYYFYREFIFTLVADNNNLLELKLRKTVIDDAKFGENEILSLTKTELDEYFNGKRKTFDVTISFNGTSFQKRVWKCLSRIPYGETISYKELARRIGNIKACRAVGMANNKNPLPIIIPCHRVVGINGNLTGYAGGVKLKQDLLNLEKKYYANN